MLFLYIQESPDSTGPVWFVFAGMGTQWVGMGRALMTLAAFHDSIQRSASILMPLGVDLVKLVMGEDDSAFEDTINAFVGIASIQVRKVQILQSFLNNQTP